MSRLDQVLESWKGTPYSHNASTRGVGVDCRYFVLCVLDEMFRITEPLPERLAPDLGYNNTPAAEWSVASMARRYPHEIVSLPVEPGDIVIVRPAANSPSHGMIAGGGRKIWHSVKGPGVCFTSIQQVDGRIWKILRPEKLTW